MKKYDYDITHHPVESLGRSDFVCSEDGACGPDADAERTDSLKEILNERGKLGWELVQLAFGRGGALAFWKREAVGGNG